MTKRGRKRRAARRALVGATLVSGIALMGTQLALGAGNDVCRTGHGTVAAASSQQFETVVSAAQAGNADAMVEVGHMYRDGLGVPRDLVKARAWLSFAAYKGAPVDQDKRAVSNCLSTSELRKADATFFAILRRDEG